jgi:hypothetical protein
MLQVFNLSGKILSKIPSLKETHSRKCYFIFDKPTIITQHEKRKLFKIFNLNKINRSILKGCKGGILHCGALSFWIKSKFQILKKNANFL